MWKQQAAAEVLLQQMAVHVREHTEEIKVSCVSKKDYIHENIEEWRRNNIDVLLCPCIGPAFNFQYCGRLTGNVCVCVCCHATYWGTT